MAERDSIAVLLFDNSPWRKEAACRGMPASMFFLEHGEPSGEALRVCGDCTVWEECARAGMYESAGIWGGIAPRDRRKIRRQQKAATNAVNGIHSQLPEIGETVRDEKLDASQDHISDDDALWDDWRGNWDT